MEATECESEPAGLVRPRTRAECCDVPRPCPFVSCRYNLLIDVGANGALTLITEDRASFTRTASAAAFDAAADAAIFEWYDGPKSPPSCALDVIEANGADENSLDLVGRLLGVTRERARQIEAQALSTERPKLAALGTTNG